MSSFKAKAKQTLSGGDVERVAFHIVSRPVPHHVWFGLLLKRHGKRYLP